MPVGALLAGAATALPAIIQGVTTVAGLGKDNRADQIALAEARAREAEAAAAAAEAKPKSQTAIWIAVAFGVVVIAYIVTQKSK